MNARLMHADRDFDFQPPQYRPAAYRDRAAGLPVAPHEEAVIQDLELNTVLDAMARQDQFLFDVARQALLSGVHNDIATVRYRQDILGDCLAHREALREMYGVALDAIDAKKHHYWGFVSRYPSGILHGSMDLMRALVLGLRRLRAIADAQAGQFQSAGFSSLFTMLQRELSDAYLADVENQLAELRFRHGVLLSAELGRGNEGDHYVLRLPREDKRSLFEQWLGSRSPGYVFRIHERDDAGARILSELQDRGINLVANALAQSAEHILGFFEMLRAELAFYIGCVNLHEALAALGAPACMPDAAEAGTRTRRFTELYDVCLALTMGKRVVGNTLQANGRILTVVTGANQGGKSTFLRSIGVAQLMMQAGMFVGAGSFAADLCTGVFTHFKREEDQTMTHGKLDEELARLSGLADVIAPGAVVLFNESFASTNEREGSEIARQVVSALIGARITVFFVTHLYEFARRMFERRPEDAVFLRAERLPDGTRTFRLVEAEPLETSYGGDVYREIFGAAAGPVRK